MHFFICIKAIFRIVYNFVFIEAFESFCEPLRVGHDYSLCVIELGVEWMKFGELFLLSSWSSLPVFLRSAI